MMKHISLIVICTILCIGCTTTPTPREELLTHLKTHDGGVFFGHHDDLLYGHTWHFEPGRSDVKEICGAYPAVVSFDLGRIELGDSLNLDSVPFALIQRAARTQHARGGIVSISWHPANPITGGESWILDHDTTKVISTVLEGGSNHVLFMQWLDKVHDFFLELKDVPILFRPWHEATGTWFWWSTCYGDYKALWRMTYDHFKDLNNLVFAYSPGLEFTDSVTYLRDYPGDDVVDLIGYDAYQWWNIAPKEVYMSAMRERLSVLRAISKTHNKLFALTETGLESLTDSTWYTGTLLPIIQDFPDMSYVLVWRNAWNKPEHFFAPYVGHPAQADFKTFYEANKGGFVL